MAAMVYIAEYPIEHLYRDERVQRISEGTNEINRLLIFGLFIRKGVNGKSPDQTLGLAATGNFAAEKQVLKGMKRRYLAPTDHGVRKFGGAEAAGE